MRTWGYRAALAAIGLLVTFQCPGKADPRLFGTIGRGGTISTLVEIDPVTGALVQTIGSVGYAVNGLTYDATTGKLYGSTSVKDPNFMGLIEINMATGAGTEIGSGWGLGSSPIVCITTNQLGDM